MTTEPSKLDLLLEQYPDESIPADLVLNALGLSREDIRLGSTMRCWRQCEGWNLSQGAELLGISKQLLSDYERGTKLPSIKKTIEMATLFEVDPAIWLRYRLQDELRQNGFEGTFHIHRIA